MNGCKKTLALMDAVKKSGGGKVQTSADTARKLATEMGGMKKGGKPKGGLAVMIAIGKAKPEDKAAGGAGKTRKGCAPIKRKQGGTNKRDGMPREGVSTRPTTSTGRRITMKEMEQAGRDFGGMTAAQIRAAGEAVARGNREPYEPIPKAKGGAAKVRKGMMSTSGDIRQAVKPKKGIGGIM